MRTRKGDEGILTRGARLPPGKMRMDEKIVRDAARAAAGREGAAAGRYNHGNALRRSRRMSRRVLFLSSLVAALAAPAVRAQPQANVLRVGVRRLPERLSPA